MIHVLIVDDQEIVRTGIAMLLKPKADIEVVGLATGGLTAIVLALQLQPDVVLMDVRMPDLDGIAVTERLAQLCPQIRVILITTFEEDKALLAGLRAGARGYLLKDVSSDMMAEAIRVVASGHNYLQPSVQDRLIRVTVAQSMVTDRAKAADGLLEPLTEREHEVLQQIALGRSNAEIANVLYITVGTVKNHVSNILDKLDARDRTEALVRAQGLDLV
jgi:DNA-binding NarL/FixJ family response regulator